MDGFDEFKMVERWVRERMSSFVAKVAIFESHSNNDRNGCSSELLHFFFSLLKFLLGPTLLVPLPEGDGSVHDAPDLGYGATGRNGVPPNCVIQFEVDLISWITVVDVCKNDGIIKKMMDKGEQIGSLPSQFLPKVFEVMKKQKGTRLTKLTTKGAEFKAMQAEAETPVDYEPPFFRSCIEQEAHSPWTKNPLKIERLGMSTTNILY